MQHREKEQERMQDSMVLRGWRKTGKVKHKKKSLCCRFILQQVIKATARAMVRTLMERDKPDPTKKGI